MNGFRDEFFSRAALAGDEDSRARRGHLFDDAKDFLHHVGSSDDCAAIDFAAHGLSQRTALFFFAAPFDARGDLRADMLVLERLADAAKRAFFPSRDGRVERCISSDHEDHCIRIQL